MTTMPVSNLRVQEPIAPVRDPRQRAVVEAIVAADDFDFACGNPFPADMGGYVGPFSFLYYTKDGQLHLERIARDGQILSDLTPTP